MEREGSEKVEAEILPPAILKTNGPKACRCGLVENAQIPKSENLKLRDVEREKRREVMKQLSGNGSGEEHKNPAHKKAGSWRCSSDLATLQPCKLEACLDGWMAG